MGIYANGCTHTHILQVNVFVIYFCVAWIMDHATWLAQHNFSSCLLLCCHVLWRIYGLDWCCNIRGAFQGDRIFVERFLVRIWQFNLANFLRVYTLGERFLLSFTWKSLEKIPCSKVPVASTSVHWPSFLGVSERRRTSWGFALGLEPHIKNVLQWKNWTIRLGREIPFCWEPLNTFWVSTFYFH